MSASLSSPRGGDSSGGLEDGVQPLSGWCVSRKGQLLPHWTARMLWTARLSMLLMDPTSADSPGIWGPHTFSPEPPPPTGPDT